MKKLKKIIAFACLFSLVSAPFAQADDLELPEDEVDSLIADYVIIGVGTAGGLMANRLTDDKHTSVIALHNGENLTQDPLIKYSQNAIFTVFASLFGFLNDPSVFTVPSSIETPFNQFLSRIPGGVPFLYEQGLSIPQVNDDNRQILWEIALPEGGASSINAGAWCRGTDQAYAQWEQIAGDNWSVERINRIYKGLEDYHGKTPDPEFRGCAGPIDVLMKKPSKLAKTFNKAFLAGTGLPDVLDYNDPLTPIGGSTRLQLTQRGPNGAYRVSSATAFLNRKVMTPEGKGVKGRRLRVHFNSIALRTIWDGNRAIGVEFIEGNQTKQVRAKKGVIVCAGLYSSKFLMYSGVGPASQLESLGIPVVSNNSNVGQGLFDQSPVYLAFLTNPKDFPKHDNSIFSQIAWMPNPAGDPTVRQFRFSTAKLFPGFSAGVVDLLTPQSRGSVSINNANPLSPPVIDYGIFSNPADFDSFQRILSTYIFNICVALPQIDPKYELIFPGLDVLSDPLLLSIYIKQILGTNMSFQGHCRMAPQNQGGVVDSTGLVYGTQNLYVADDSIVPSPMDGSTMASAYLIAENIAQLLGY